MRRALAVAATLAVAFALAGQTARGWGKLRSTVIVGSVARAMAGVQRQGSAPAALVRGAEAALAEAARLDPAAIEPRAFRGDLLLVVGRPEAAVAAYARAADHEPRAETLLHQGLALWRLGRRDEAVVQLRRATALAPPLLRAVPPEAAPLVAAAPLVPLPPAAR